MWKVKSLELKPVSQALTISKHSLPSTSMGPGSVDMALSLTSCIRGVTKGGEPSLRVLLGYAMKDIRELKPLSSIGKVNRVARAWPLCFLGQGSELELSISSWPHGTIRGPQCSLLMGFDSAEHNRPLKAWPPCFL